MKATSNAAQRPISSSPISISCDSCNGWVAWAVRTLKCRPNPDAPQGNGQAHQANFAASSLRTDTHSHIINISCMHRIWNHFFNARWSGDFHGLSSREIVLSRLPGFQAEHSVKNFLKCWSKWLTNRDKPHSSAAVAYQPNALSGWADAKKKSCAHVKRQRVEWKRRETRQTGIFSDEIWLRCDNDGAELDARLPRLLPVG